MKKTTLLLLLALLSPSTFAANSPGSTCGLVDDTRGVDDVSGSSLVLQGNRLTLLQELQVITAAQTIFASQEIVYRDVKDAIIDLEGFSSSRVFLDKVKINGRIYDELVTYPNDNMRTVLFLEGTVAVVGTIRATSVFCL